ncbi:REP-associated tyrosine transposase [Hymenobacter latericus]|uniref:REP-associated tyrosine transposase n=1 Tax=Hymenobacter sp. YIM 151858-1 TaxID=2987688 RepID=UPI0022279D79|nr:transposase [Hymenobacter sp. YIM 151858-1]UYZ59380.1 transposase [Hymenobacter sp. YIM 151858-1]
MSEKYKVRSSDEVYFLTFTLVEWVDLFTRKSYKDIIVRSLAYCQAHKGLELYAYCIMSNHVHLIARATPPATLSGIVRDFKKFTARTLMLELETNPQESRRSWLRWMFERNGMGNAHNQHIQVWQQRSHPVALTSDELVQQRLRYVHDNPVRAGICFLPEEYVYSSAAQYAGREAILPVLHL